MKVGRRAGSLGRPSHSVTLTTSSTATVCCCSYVSSPLEATMFTTTQLLLLQPSRRSVKLVPSLYMYLASCFLMKDSEPYVSHLHWFDLCVLLAQECTILGFRKRNFKTSFNSSSFITGDASWYNSVPVTLFTLLLAQHHSFCHWWISHWPTARDTMGHHPLCSICLPWTGDTPLHPSFSSLPSSLLSFLLFINANDFVDLLSDLHW